MINNISVFNKISENPEFSTKQTSYSPMYSTIGLQADKTGLNRLFFHYNRATHTLFDEFIHCTMPLDKEKSDISKLIFTDKDKLLSLAFYKNDCFICECENINSLDLLNVKNEKIENLWTVFQSKKLLIVRGYSDNNDGRDPDKTVPFEIGIKLLKGTFNNFTVNADNNKIIFSFCLTALEISEEKTKKLLNKSPDSVNEASVICREWFLNGCKNLIIDTDDKEAEAIVSNSVLGLLFNTAKAQGSLSKHLSAFPSRGGYPAHFLWDTCFQNLAYEITDIDIAKDFILQNIENQRIDGKYEQFLCSTWGRPHETQPQLIGWAGYRIYEQTKDKRFAKKLLHSLEKNNEWWFSQRLSSNGCIFCPHGLETGQDDSPRFDKGSTYPTDMNSYFLNQINITVKLAEILNLKSKVKYWSDKAALLKKAIIENLYDKKTNLFYDVNLKTGKKIKIISPVSLLPLWAGVKIGENKEKQMIEDYLLNSKKLFGNIPFPSVAYDEKCYETDGWWRGPTWMPEAWLMLELLKKYGYEKEYADAVNRLYNILLNDKEMHELFNSQTGEGMGNAQQGWTCAIFIKLCKELKG